MYNLLRTSIDKIKENGFTFQKRARSRRYQAETITDADYADEIAFLTNKLTETESCCLAAGGIGLHVIADKTEYICFNQEKDTSTLNVGSLKLVDKFTYLSSSVSSTESDINMCLTKVWTAIDKQSIIWKSDLSDKLKLNFF